jgi:hypothetical protein
VDAEVTELMCGFWPITARKLEGGVKIRHVPMSRELGDLQENVISC